MRVSCVCRGPTKQPSAAMAVQVVAMIIVSDNLTDKPASAVLYRGIIKFVLDERRYFIILAHPYSCARLTMKRFPSV